MPNKEVSRVQGAEMKPTVTVQHVVTKSPSVTVKATSKAMSKETAMSPTGAPSADTERTELLGSVTTEQQQRTSARVIKKLKLDPPGDRDKRTKRADGQPDDITECETPSKLEDKELKFPMVKQRMPKAIWSADEKSLFFEALNEYGKDFDAITTYICAKLKKKGMPDVNLKTKTQVSHFYYRTWHKLSKHVRFDENVKKVAQELYALINYGELRKKLVAVSEKTCARLGEMVRGGALVVRARGRNIRVRTPMCRALRRLNQINELACGVRVCTRAQVVLRARTRADWARVQAAAHNPRAALHAPLRARLADLLLALQRRWRTGPYYKPERTVIIDKCPEDLHVRDEDNYAETQKPCPEDRDGELMNHLHLETDRSITQEYKLPHKLALHVGPKPEAEVHLPVVSPSEQLSSQKICFSSYLERMCTQRRDKDLNSAKIRTTKRQRKDSGTEKDKELEQKKIKLEEEAHKLMHIDETAIDGIDLMASYRLQEDEEKPSTEDEKEMKSEETAEEEIEREPERDKDMSEKEKDSFSEMEDDEKYNKSDTDNESDSKGEKSGKGSKFKNLKVKFRIRPKKRGGSIYTLVFENELDVAKLEDTAKEDDLKTDEPRLDEIKTDDVKTEEPKTEEPKAEEPKPEETKAIVDVDTALRQIRKGWSIYDAGDLTIGDLYLMFGSRSRLELDYWWAEPTAPLPQPVHKKTESPPAADKDKHGERKPDKTPDKGTDSSVEDDRDRARESDTDIFSPKNTFSQDSNDGLSGDERKSEQLASPEHKSSSATCGTLKLVSKLINRPLAPATAAKDNGFSQLGDRLKRLLALAGNPQLSAGGGGIARCDCGHVCPMQRKQKQPVCAGLPPPAPEPPPSAVFRHPTPIAPRPEQQAVGPGGVSLEGMPRWRRGRPRLADRRVVVQRLLPLLPKLPPPSNLIPVKIVPNCPPAPPRILPKPSPTAASDLSLFYVLSESNGQFYFHDGDQRIPITSLQAKNGTELHADEDEVHHEEESGEVKSECPEVSTSTAEDKPAVAVANASGVHKTDADMAQFLPTESLSLSPSRLLRDSEGWLEGSVQDFSLSSFLGHLEGRQQPDLAVDSQLQSLMAESSVDYVAKFADLAAEVTDEGAPLPADELA